ncbi:MAG: methylated-DNA--[protein]-cysteine S-methyltransferase [Firmicutes bacterium]|nr:methylated-DNA--[protein]-cysteine S-methyltransferase [Bacillota bacterium]
MNEPAGGRIVSASVDIGYGLYESPFGQFIIAATPRGVCFLEIGDDPQALVAELKRRYPQAAVVHDPGRVDGWARSLLHYLRGGGSPPSIPLDVKGTRFQQRVWMALQSIPPGATRTYGEIADQIGCPQASRAVGRACGANPVLIVVPCHRVTRKDGALGGFRGGRQLKAALLAWERRIHGEGTSVL